MYCKGPQKDITVSFNTFQDVHKEQNIFIQF